MLQNSIHRPAPRPLRSSRHSFQSNPNNAARAPQSALSPTQHAGSVRTRTAGKDATGARSQRFLGREQQPFIAQQCYERPICNDDYRSEVYSDQTALLGELHAFGWMHYNKAMSGAFEANQHPNQLEIHYIRRGHVTWWFGDQGQQHDIRAGQICIIQAGEVHGGLEGSMQACEHYWLRLTLPAPGTSLPGLSARETRLLLESLQTIDERVADANQEIDSLFNMLLRQHQRGPHKLARTCARSIVHTLLTLVPARHHSKRNSACKPYSWRVRRATRWLEERLFESDIEFEQLCESLKISHSGLRNRFKEETAYTPQEYVTKKRMEAACQLLKQSNQSITAIAVTLGHSSSQYFATVFKTYFGLTPASTASATAHNSAPTPLRRQLQLPLQLTLTSIPLQSMPAHLHTSQVERLL